MQHWNRYLQHNYSLTTIYKTVSYKSLLSLSHCLLKPPLLTRQPPAFRMRRAVLVSGKRAGWKSSQGNAGNRKLEENTAKAHIIETWNSLKPENHRSKEKEDATGTTREKQRLRGRNAFVSHFEVTLEQTHQNVHSAPCIDSRLLSVLDAGCCKRCESVHFFELFLTFLQFLHLFSHFYSWSLNPIHKYIPFLKWQRVQPLPCPLSSSHLGR